MDSLLVRRAGLPLAAWLAMCSAGPCLAESYYDFAEVLECTPVLEQERVPVLHTVCAAEDPIPPEEDAGWLHEHNPGLGLADWIGRDARRRATPANTCSERVDFEIRKRVIGFDVRYRYAHAEYVQRMDRDPGRRLRVRVDIESH